MCPNCERGDTSLSQKFVVQGIAKAVKELDESGWFSGAGYPVSQKDWDKYHEKISRARMAMIGIIEDNGYELTSSYGIKK